MNFNLISIVQKNILYFTFFLLFYFLFWVQFGILTGPWESQKQEMYSNKFHKKIDTLARKLSSNFKLKIIGQGSNKMYPKRGSILIVTFKHLFRWKMKEISSKNI